MTLLTIALTLLSERFSTNGKCLPARTKQYSIRTTMHSKHFSLHQIAKPREKVWSEATSCKERQLAYAKVSTKKSGTGLTNTTQVTGVVFISLKYNAFGSVLKW